MCIWTALISWPGLLFETAERAEAIPRRGLLSQSTRMQASTGLRPWWMIPSNARRWWNLARGAAVSTFLPKGEHFMSTTPIIPTPPAGGTTPASGSPLPTPQSLNNMFLQLLVAQLQNQSPLNPMDPTQFVGQLAQFSELSEATSIYQLLQQSVGTAGLRLGFCCCWCHRGRWMQ